MSEVCTSVRDGRTTEADLRGNRVAELITRLAATHQVADDVRPLVRSGELPGQEPRP